MILEAIGVLLWELLEVMDQLSLLVSRVGNYSKGSLSLLLRTVPGVRSILMILTGQKVKLLLGSGKDF